jgi:hypothetical protein
MIKHVSKTVLIALKFEDAFWENKLAPINAVRNWGIKQHVTRMLCSIQRHTSLAHSEGSNIQAVGMTKNMMTNCCSCPTLFRQCETCPAVCCNPACWSHLEKPFEMNLLFGSCPTLFRQRETCPAVCCNPVCWSHLEKPFEMNLLFGEAFLTIHLASLTWVQVS